MILRIRRIYPTLNQRIANWQWDIKLIIYVLTVCVSLCQSAGVAPVLILGPSGEWLMVMHGLMHLLLCPLRVRNEM